jgi:hypothetical protein
MPYITSVERIGMERGLQQGKLEGEATLLLRQLTKRFGPLNEVTRNRLNNATLEQLELWAEPVLDVPMLEAVFGGH